MGDAKGAREEVFVVAISSSSCGDTLEGDFKTLSHSTFYTPLKDFLSILKTIWLLLNNLETPSQRTMMPKAKPLKPS